jgi:2-methylisocitrate lyase-like PEP mutase family enzyme
MGIGGQIQMHPQLVHGPCVLNILFGGKSPLVSFDLIEQAGYRLAFLSDVLLGSAFAAYDHALRLVKDAVHCTGIPQLTHIAPAREIFRRLGSEYWDSLRAS